MSAPVLSDWPSGQERTYYLYSPLAVSAAAARMACLPFRSYNDGLACKQFINQDLGSRYQIALVLVNAGFRPIPAGFSYRLGVQVAP